MGPPLDDEVQNSDEEAEYDIVEVDESEIVIEKKDENISEFFLFLDKPHEYFSTRLENMARNIDDYFTDNIESYQSTGSYLKLRQNMLFREGGKIEHETKVDLRLRVPNTEKNLNLFFASPDEKQPYDIATKSEKKSVDTNVDSDYVMGIQGESGEGFGWKYRPVIGSTINPKFDLFVRFRFLREVEYGRWSINWHETPFWFDSIGWGMDSYLELNKKLDESSLFRISTFAGWKDDTDEFELNHIYSMFHTLDDYSALSYYAGVYGITEDRTRTIRTEKFLIGMTYRYGLHRNYLFFEVSPQVAYEVTNRFRPDHTLLLSLEMVFSK